jgi:hypothetical protein
MSGNATVTANYTPTAYMLTVNSTNPASGVLIDMLLNGVSGPLGKTSVSLTQLAGTTLVLTAPTTASGNNFSSWTGCTSATTVTCTVVLSGNTTVTAKYATPGQTYTLTVNSTNPATGVAIGASPADNNSASNGSTSFTRTYNSGTSVTLTAPAISGSNSFGSWTGCTSTTTVTCTVALSGNVSVTANYKITPTVAVTPSASNITTAQPLTATVAVSGGTGNPTPTGTVKITSGTYTSAATALASGSVQINIPAASLAAGSDTLTATYTPDSAGSSTYTTASGTSSAITVATVSAVTVNQSAGGLAVTDQILGMDMAAWFDPTNSFVVPAFQAAGIKAMRWPGGSWSDNYHWNGNFTCTSTTGNPPFTPTGWADPHAVYTSVISNLQIPAGLDVALTADYGTNAACTGPGDPTEAAGWVQVWEAHGGTVSHMTVGNENYGSWETDLHTKKNDPATYTAAVAGANGYYQLIKNADSNVKVGVDIEPNYAPWDATVLAGAPYDFVEYHYYPQGPGQESDSYLVKQAAQGLTTNINTIKSELATAGKSGTPIYVGEIGSVYTLPGRQSSSITQALYAGQVLGEMMNDGVSRATWWIGFGGCDDKNSYQVLSGGTKQYANFNTPGLAYQTNVYGWQDYGGYMVFSDGLPENGCGSTPLAAGTLLPTARAFQLFSNVAVTGESVLTATTTGDTTDVRAYAATHSGGTALVLFNLNQTANASVTVNLSLQNSSTGVSVITYDKALYDQTNAATPVWAAPTTTNLGAQSLPLTLTLTPWSMNVVIIK